MTDVLKDFSFTLAYQDDISIFHRMAEIQLIHIKEVFEKLWNAHLSMKLSKCHFFTKESSTLDTSSAPKASDLYHQNPSHKNMSPPKTAKQVCTFLGLIGYYRKFIKNFAKMAKPVTLLTHHKAKFEWTSIHHTAFLTLKE